MLIVALEQNLVRKADAAIERSIAAPVFVPDAALNFWGEFYRANPMLRSRGITFEAFLSYTVRNGALFEKLRHRRSKRTGRSTFRPNREES